MVNGAASSFEGTWSPELPGYYYSASEALILAKLILKCVLQYPEYHFPGKDVHLP